ncbi:MAG: transcriptional regulator NrdR [Rickettsiales bacterium]|jgi:transcriptional repressor NrdR|nr:transcriptional regulator NrdR [Rickettsiales bacterium]
MKCPYCNSIDSQVKDSRPNEDDGTIRRRRVCNSCGAKFSTIERTQVRELSVRKSSGKIEPFDRDKIYRAIKIAYGKRHAGAEHLEKVTNSIYKRLEAEAESDVIDSIDIGDMVAETLLNLDHIAYIRFVSVYRKFATLADFKKELAKIPDGTAVAADGDKCDLPKKFTNGSLF